MNFLKKYAHEPLLHFVVIGLVLFFLVEAFYPNSDSYTQSQNTIAFDQEKIIQFLQFQNKAFNVANAKAKWLSMNDTEKSQLMTDYIREEVMYREALSLGLEKDDQIIRRRLIQKIEFINRGFQSDMAKINEEEIEQFFKQHKQEYQIDPSITFTHVFFDKKFYDSEGQGDQTLQIATETLKTLNASKVPFEQASQYGQRFYFHRNYVDRTPAFVASHFGEDFSQNTFKFPQANKWVGPVTSKYGQHLVMVSKNLPSRSPKLGEVAGQVLNHLQRIKQRELKQKSLSKMIEKYKLENNTSFSFIEPSVMEQTATQEQQANAK